MYKPVSADQAFEGFLDMLQDNFNFRISEKDLTLPVFTAGVQSFES